MDVQDKGGFTPLHLAAFRGHTDLALALVAAGASPTTPSNDGSCALSHRPPPNDVLRDARSVPSDLRAAMLARIAQPLPWLPDAMSDNCQVCGSAFTGSNRRHHCRHCGRIVCASCSPAKATIPKFGVTKATRVCAECAPVLELHGKKALGPPGVGGLSGNRAASAAVSSHLDAVVASINTGVAGVTGDVGGALPPHGAAAPSLAPPPNPMPPLPQASSTAANPFGGGEDAAPPAPAPTGAAANPFGDVRTPPDAPAANPFGDDTPPDRDRPVPTAKANPFGELEPPGEANPFGAEARAFEPPAAGTNPFSDAEDGSGCNGGPPASTVSANPFESEDEAGA